MKKFEVLFAKGAASRECVWKNESSSKSQLKIEVCWKWYGGTLTVEDGEDFDIEAVSLNKNSEWKKYNFLGCTVSKNMSESIRKKAIEMLLNGATLLSEPCPYCKGVRVMKDGDALCVNCGKSPDK